MGESIFNKVFRVVLLLSTNKLTNCLSLFMSENVSTLSHQMSLAEYKFQNFISTLQMLLYCPPMLTAVKSAVSLNVISLQAIYLHSFYIFSLFLIFWSLVLICVGVINLYLSCLGLKTYFQYDHLCLSSVLENPQLSYPQILLLHHSCHSISLEFLYMSINESQFILNVYIC